MTKWSIVVCILLISKVHAQEKNNSRLPDTECAFAKYASTHNVKQAFLKFLDSNGIIFYKGIAFNGIASWKRQPDNNFRLAWHPAYYVVSADSSLGFTTGPYEAGDGSDKSFGNFTSIWRKDNNNDWKLLTDLGTRYASSLYDTSFPATFTRLTSADDSDTSALQIEDRFIRSLSQHNISAYNAVIADESWLNIDKHHPPSTLSEKQKQLSLLQGLQFVPIAGNIAKTRDLAYVYGTIQYKSGKENYLRVWGHTIEGWKILCQVIKIVE